MASSKNQSGSTGLRILWIPGRKRQHRKGRIDATNKKTDYSQKQKKSEPWSLGGIKTQNDFIKSDFADLEAGPSGVAKLLLPASTCVIAGAVEAGAELATDKDSNLNMKSDNIEIALLDKVHKSSDQLHDDSGTGSGTLEMPNTSSPKKHDVEHHQNNLDNEIEMDAAASASSSSTMPLTNKHPQNNIHHHHHHKRQNGKCNDMDSIESLGAKPKTISNDIDSIDGSLYSFSNCSDKELNKKKKAKNNRNDDEEKDDKCVTCLYYTCLCCDCTIS